MRLLALLSVLACVVLWAGPADTGIERGRYLAEEVAKCQECHTPRGADGKLDKSKWMKGTKLDFQPVGDPPPGWHTASPDLTPSGKLWQRWGEDGFRKFLETGKTPRGGSAGPPMPTYTLKPEDAAAMIAYFKSLS